MDVFLKVFSLPDGAGKIAGFDVGGELGDVQHFVELVFLFVVEADGVDSLVRDVARGRDGIEGLGSVLFFGRGGWPRSPRDRGL